MRRRFLYSLNHKPFTEAVYHRSFKFQTIQAYDLMCSLLFISAPFPIYLCSSLSPIKSFPPPFSSLHHFFHPEIPPSNSCPRNWMLAFFLTSDQVWDISRILWITNGHRKLPAIQISQQVWRQVFTNIRLVMGHRNDNIKILLSSLPI